MKVRNVVFSGFAAAILMGTVNANAVSFNIASKDYVDSKVATGLTDSNNNPVSVADALATKVDKSATSATLPAADNAAATNWANEKAVADALATKANSADVYTKTETYTKDEVDDAISAISGDAGSISEQIDAALGGDFTGTNPNFDTVSDALATKVDKSATSATLPAADNAAATKWANEKAVADALATKADASTVDALGTTVGDNGSGLVKDVNDLKNAMGNDSVAEQIDDALGDLGTHTDAQSGNLVDNTVADALALKADKADVYTKSQTYTQEQVNALLAQKMGIPNPDACTPAADGSSFCVLTKGTDGTLYWANVTAPFNVQ